MKKICEKPLPQLTVRLKCFLVGSISLDFLPIDLRMGDTVKKKAGVCSKGMKRGIRVRFSIGREDEGKIYPLGKLRKKN